jgi:hypothetical protein
MRPSRVSGGIPRWRRFAERSRQLSFKYAIHAGQSLGNTPLVIHGPAMMAPMPFQRPQVFKAVYSDRPIQVFGCEMRYTPVLFCTLS